MPFDTQMTGSRERRSRPTDVRRIARSTPFLIVIEVLVEHVVRPVFRFLELL